MAENWKPSDDYPGITQERLLVVADIIRVAREGAADDHRPEHGESNWSLGCRAYERTTFALSLASQTLPWLRILAGGIGPAHFVMSMGNHPVRFCSGEPDDMPEKYQQLSFPEAIGWQKAFELDSHLPLNRAVRITIDPDASGRPNDIYLVEIDETTGGVTNTYLVPALAKSTTVTDFAPPVKAVEIPPVAAEPIETEEEKETADNDIPKAKTGSDDE